MATIALGASHRLISNETPFRFNGTLRPRSLFPTVPRPVGVAASWLSDEFLPLFPEEEQAVRNSVAKRRIEFATGRYCARMAMAQLGIRLAGFPADLTARRSGRLGLVGSITHSTDFCAAVVARSDCFQTIGIDAEPIDAIPAELVERHPSGPTKRANSIQRRVRMAPIGRPSISA